MTLSQSQPRKMNPQEATRKFLDRMERLILELSVTDPDSGGAVDAAQESASLVSVVHPYESTDLPRYVETCLRGAAYAIVYGSGALMRQERNREDQGRQG